MTVAKDKVVIKLATSTDDDAKTTFTAEDLKAGVVVKLADAKEVKDAVGNALDFESITFAQ